MKWNPSRNATDNVRRKLPKLTQKYFRGGRQAVKEEAPERLHRFRLQTKRFRYTLELFRPIYGPSLDRHLKSLRGIQDALGKINDYETICELIAGDKQLLADVRKAQQKKVKEFRQEWKKFDSDGQMRRWKAYLTRATTAPRKRSVRKKSTPAA